MRGGVFSRILTYLQVGRENTHKLAHQLLKFQPEGVEGIIMLYSTFEQFETCLYFAMKTNSQVSAFLPHHAAFHLYMCTFIFFKDAILISISSIFYACIFICEREIMLINQQVSLMVPPPCGQPRGAIKLVGNFKIIWHGPMYSGE